MKLKALVAAFAVVFGVSAAQAGLTIEPFLGHSISGELKDDDGEKTDFKALNYGARLGYGMLGFEGGVEYRGGTGEEDDNGEKTDAKYTAISVYAGYTFPILVRAWASYSLSHKLTLEDTDGDIDVKGKTLIIGAGFTGLPIVSINVEYHMMSYDKAEFGGTTFDLDDFSGKMIMLSVSAPIGIPFL